MVGTSDGVGCQQGNELGGRESSTIFHTGEDHVEGVLGLGDQTIGSGGGSVGTSAHERKAGCTRAVGNGDGSSELDEVTGSDGVVLLEEGGQSVNTVTDTEVGVEVGLDVGEDEHGPISTSTGGFSLAQERLRERDGVVCK